MKRFILALIFTLTIALTACTPMQSSSSQIEPQNASAPTGSASSSGNSANVPSDLTRSDGQGSVMVEITPLNLMNPSSQLEFNVAMNTHSVDLSMDLAALATLSTDTGITVQAAAWDAPRGGHHLNGKLIFPALKDSKSILQGATILRLTIIGLEAPARVFEWQLP